MSIKADATTVALLSYVVNGSNKELWSKKTINLRFAGHFQIGSMNWNWVKFLACELVKFGRQQLELVAMRHDCVDQPV